MSRVIFSFFDMYYVSCANGLGYGGLAVSGGDQAAFFYDLFNLKFVKTESINSMLDCTIPPWKTEMKYGLGLENPRYLYRSSEPSFCQPPPLKDFCWFPKDHGFIADTSTLHGHQGTDWGSRAAPCGYNSLYDFSFCFIKNTQRTAMTTAEGAYNTKSFEGPNIALLSQADCEMYQEALVLMGGPKLLCNWLPPSPKNLFPPTTEVEMKWGKKVVSNDTWS
jgi:hypothetical protein